MRWMNRLFTAVIVLAVVAGPPLLAAVLLVHHPWRAPSRSQVERWAQQPLTAGTIVTGCALIAGVAWLLLITYLIRRGIAELRRRQRRWRHLAVPTPAQMTAGSMAGLAAFTLPALPTAHPVAPAAAGATDTFDPGTTAPERAQSAQAQPAGITLPGGGWIPYRTAAAISALATLTWLQTRRHYRPDPHHPRGHDTDHDLQPAPDTVHAVMTAFTDDTPAQSDHLPPPLPPQQLPDGILLLTGPGAAAAARGLLVTAALSATGRRTPAVLMRPRDLHTLMPASDITTLAFTESPTGTPRPPTGPASPPGIAHEDPDRLGVTAAEHRDPRTGTLIVLDDNTAATHHWHITADGYATGTGLTGKRRLSALDPQTANDLLAVLHPRPQVAVAESQPAPGHPGPTASTRHPVTAARLILLGACQLSVAGVAVHIRRTAGLQILAYLAVHADGATRSELTRALWPHLPAATISQRLHTTLADLRQQLRPLLDDDPITRNDDRYHLNTRTIATDLQLWRTAVDAMAHAVGTTAQHHACQLVADLYQGELAAGQSWPWLTAIREQTRRTVIDACATLAMSADPDQASTWLQRAITLDPYNEPLHQQAAELLHNNGDESGAADLIKRLYQRLATASGNGQ